MYAMSMPRSTSLGSVCMIEWASQLTGLTCLFITEIPAAMVETLFLVAVQCKGCIMCMHWHAYRILCKFRSDHFISPDLKSPKSQAVLAENHSPPSKSDCLYCIMLTVLTTWHKHLLQYEVYMIYMQEDCPRTICNEYSEAINGDFTWMNYWNYIKYVYLLKMTSTRTVITSANQKCLSHSSEHVQHIHQKAISCQAATMLGSRQDSANPCSPLA